MIPTAARLSKASRLPLTPKRGNKDFYKGTRQAFLPGGRRTGAPGKHVVGGKAKYRLLDEKVRVYVAPNVHEIDSSPLKPYVALGTRLSKDEEIAVFGHFRGPMGLTPKHFLRVAREHTFALQNPEFPYRDSQETPDWMGARIRLGMMPSSQKGVAVKEEQPMTTPGGKGPREAAILDQQRHRKPLKELEIVD